MFMQATNDRKPMYIKGQTTAISGYLARRLNQGSGNVYTGHNGICFADGNTIVSF